MVRKNSNASRLSDAQVRELAAQLRAAFGDPAALRAAAAQGAAQAWARLTPLQRQAAVYRIRAALKAAAEESPVKTEHAPLTTKHAHAHSDYAGGRHSHVHEHQGEADHDHEHTAQQAASAKRMASSRGGTAAVPGRVFNSATAASAAVDAAFANALETVRQFPVPPRRHNRKGR